jgi:hypothetical protein
VIRIPLCNQAGEVIAHALVDDEDAWAAAHRWFLINDRYAARNKRNGGGRRIVRLHRELLGLAHGDGLYADHINRDTLDNRRSNLRVGTPALNMQNVPGRPGTSRFRGVSYFRPTGKWRAVCHIDRKQYHVGYFGTEEEAAAAASAFRSEHMPFAVEAS